MAHQHNPASADVYFRQGNSLYEMELYEEAIDAYTQAIRFNPNSIIAYYNRGLAKGKLGQYAGAVEDYDIAIQLNPDKADTYYNRGTTKSRLGQHREAIVDCDRPHAKACGPLRLLCRSTRAINDLCWTMPD